MDGGRSKVLSECWGHANDRPSIILEVPPSCKMYHIRGSCMITTKMWFNLIPDEGRNTEDEESQKNRPI